MNPALFPLIGQGLNLFGQMGAQRRQANMDMAAQNKQSVLQQAALALQKRQAEENRQLAFGDRTDAYGNTMSWDGTGFRTDLSPMQQALADAQQSEDYRTLTQDAPRTRAAAERKDERSQLGDDAFRKIMAEFSSRDLPTAGERGADETRVALAEREQREPARVLGMSAVRSGQTGMLPRQLQELQKQRPALERVLHDASLRGEDIASQDRSRSNQTLLGEMGQMRGIADDAQMGTRNTPVIRPDFGAEGGALTSALQTLSRDAQGQAGTLMGAASSVRPGRAGPGLDFSPLAQALQGLYPEEEEKPELDQYYSTLPQGQQDKFFEWLNMTGGRPQDLYRLSHL